MQLAEAFVVLKSKDAGMSAGINRAHRQVDTFATSANARVGAMVSGIGAAIAGLGVGLSLKHFIDEATSAEQSIARFETMLSVSSATVGSHADELRALVDELEAVNHVDDKIGRRLVQNALLFGVEAENISDVTHAAIGLAEVMGTDVETSQATLMKFLAGNTKAFDKLIPGIKRFETSEEKMAEVQRIAAAGLKAHESALNTYGGQLASMKVNFENFGESAGMAAIKILHLDDAMGMLGEGFKYLTAGTFEQERALLKMLKVMYQLQSFTPGDIGKEGAAGVKAIQQQMDAAEKRLIDDGGKRAAGAHDNKMRMINEERDAQNSLGHDVRQIWEDAQNRANSGGTFGVLGGQPAAKPMAGRIGFQKEKQDELAELKKEEERLRGRLEAFGQKIVRVPHRGPGNKDLPDIAIMPNAKGESYTKEEDALAENFRRQRQIIARRAVANKDGEGAPFQGEEVRRTLETQKEYQRKQLEALERIRKAAEQKKDSTFSK